MARKITKLEPAKISCLTVSLVDLNFVCFLGSLSLFWRKKNFKKNHPICRRKASVHLKFSLIVCNKIVAVWYQEWAPDGAFYPGGYST